MPRAHRAALACWATFLSACAALAQCPPAHLDQLFAPDGVEGDHFGYAVALDGNTAILGAPNDDTPAGSDAGSVYVLMREAGGAWTFQDRLYASDAAAGDLFGHAVAIDGETVLVGARNDDLPGAANAGSVYVFVREDGVWSQQAKLIASDFGYDDTFGECVALDGDTALIGAPFDDPPGREDVGAAYVFVRVGGVWTEQARFPGEAEYESFGGAVALSGDTAIIAPLHLSTDGPPPGKAQVFVRTADTWALQAQLTATGGSHEDHFGTSLAMSGDTLIVGAHLDDLPGAINAGSASVFVRTAGVWTQEALLVADDGAMNDFFGMAVAISGDTVIVGANGDDTPQGTNAGSAYVFTRDGGSWTQRARLAAPDGAAFDVFGSAIALDGDTAFIASYSDDTSAGLHAGSMHVFSMNPLVGDLDRDGIVGLADLSLILGAFGSCAGDAAYLPASDVDASGCVELADLSALLENFGLGCP